MKESIFKRLGRLIYNHKVVVLVIWLIIIAGCIPFLPTITTPFKTTGFVDNSSATAKADSFLSNNLDYYRNRVLIMYTSKNLLATNPAFIHKIKKSIAPLRELNLPFLVEYPSLMNQQISLDRHTAYALVLFKDNTALTPSQLQDVQKLIAKPSDMTMLIGSEALFLEGISKQTQKDLYKADMIAAPIAIITLILVFGSVVAASIPIALGAGCALTILTLLYFIGHFCTLSIFTLNIALLLGLCLSLDYSLFIITRFREELSSHSAQEALAITMHTAGRAVFFSGLAVFISLSALLIFPITILYSIGIGGLTAVFVALVSSLWILPAFLALLQENSFRIPIKIRSFSKNQRFNYWKWLSSTVLKSPVSFFIFILSLLVFLGIPFLKVNFGLSDYRILPKDAESRQFFDSYAAKYNSNTLNPILLVVSSKDSILTSKNITALYTLTKQLQEDAAIAAVSGLINPKIMSNKEYHALLKPPISNKNIKQALALTTTSNFTVLSVTSKYPSNSKLTRELISNLKKHTLGPGLRMQVTGVPVTNADVLSSINSLYMYALIWIGILTYLILLFLLRSVLLPLKAIVMNIMSLCASYGVLVFIFQEGHFHNLLNFEPQGLLDISLLIIIFCALFGFSMDYEVFLLSRIKESYLKTKDNSQSIIFGIVHSSKLITSAALIVILLCGSFLVADVLMVKEFGLGIAVAIFVDAFLVRSILVPSTMALLKSWNWYLPRWLDSLLPKN